MRRSIRYVIACVFVSGLGAVAASAAVAQEAPPAPAAPQAPAAPPASAPPPAPAPPAPPAPRDRAAEVAVPLRIDLALSRHDGDKRISNLPFTLLTTFDNRVVLRLGSDVPIQSLRSPGVVDYQPVGTNIDARVLPEGPGRYRLELGLEDSSVAERLGGGSAANIGAPVMRSNTLRTVLIVRDGEPTELVVATDKTSGETVKAEVRVTEIK